LFDEGAEGMLDAASRQCQGATVSADVSSISPVLISWVDPRPPLQHPCRWLMQGGPVKSIAYSPDGSRLARAEKCEVVVCKTESGFDVSILRGHSDNVTSVAWCGTKIATSSEDKTIKIWLEQSDGAFVCQSTFEGHR
jgi:WD40 repeat protein